MNNNTSKYVVNESMGYVDSSERMILLSSDPSLGAKNRSSVGSYFNIDLQNLLEVPVNAHSVKIDVHRIVCWNNFNNITSSNNKIRVTGLLVDNVTSLTSDITFLEGVYSPYTLNTELQRLMTSLGYKANIVTIGLILPIGKTTITLAVGSSIDFTEPNSCRGVLGFNSSVLNATGLNIAPSTAKFNPIDFLLIKSNIANSEGILVNESYGSYIAQVPLNSEPNTQIISELAQPLDIDANLFKGNIGIQKIWVELCDQDGNRVNTKGEYYSILLKLKYNFVKYDK